MVILPPVFITTDAGAVWETAVPYAVVLVTCNTPPLLMVRSAPDPFAIVSVPLANNSVPAMVV